MEMYKTINANTVLLKNNVVFAPGIICTCRTAVLMAVLFLSCIYNISCQSNIYATD